jgi:hypothetical protein
VKKTEKIRILKKAAIMIKIIYSAGLKEFEDKKHYDNSFNKIGNKDYEFILFDHRAHLGRIIENAWMLDDLYRKKDENLLKTYDELKKLITSTKADVLLSLGDNVYHPEFIKDLDVYTVLMSSDDPNSSYARTIPYIWAFDHVTCINVRYHKDMPVRMTDKLIEWGAKRATWIPYGVVDGYYNPSLTEDDIYTNERKIDLIYVGAFYREKIDSLLKLKKAFGEKFKLYGQWGLKFWGYYLLQGKWVWVNPLPQNSFVQTYQNTKIGINMHLSGELGNGRLYQLPMNGVMQICDCADILCEVFEPGKEIIGYNTIEEAIELIKYYFEHDEERKKIATAGFKRAIKDYKYSGILYNMLEKVKKGMIEDGIKYSKDGTALR